MNKLPEQGEVFRCQIPYGLDPPFVNYCQAVEVFHGLPRPFQVWRQNEPSFRVWVLIDDSLCLGLVVQNIVDPI